MQQNIHNIAINYNFLESLSDWILENFDTPPTIFLPYQLACQDLAAIFEQKTTKIPKIKAIPDINIDDFYNFFPKQDFSELKNINYLSKIDYLFFLAEEISQSKIFKNSDFAQILNIAQNFQSLFDDIKRYADKPSNIKEIDDSSLSAHRQFNLDFLRIFYHKIEQKMAKNNIFNEISRQNLLINKFCDNIEKFGLEKPLIIAGSTASITYSKRLIQTCATQKNAHIILHGLSSQEKHHENEKSPQFYLNQLINSLKTTPNQIAIASRKICNQSRIDLIEKSQIPSQDFHQINKLKFNKEELTEDFIKNIKIFHAANQIQEAKFIANHLKTTEKSSAIISNDPKFNKILESQLKKQKIPFINHENQLKNSKLSDFILILAKLIENNFASIDFLAFLKHPHNIFAKNQETLAKLEITTLRSQRKGRGLDSIYYKSQQQTPEIAEFFEKIYQNLKNFQKTEKFCDFFQNLLDLIEKFSAKNIQILLEQESHKEELTNLFLKINQLKISTKNPCQILKNLFSGIFVSKNHDPKAKIQIIPPAQARLSNFEQIILPNLNRDDFPQRQSDNWLGKKIRKELNIDLSAKKYGQSAFDFCNYFAVPKILLTRSQSKNGTAVMASPFLLRLETLLQKNNITLNSQKIEKIAQNPQKTQNLAKIAQKYHPKTLSITDIATLINDPYQIYAKKILNLRPLDKIDYQGSAREYGSFIHEVLEKYINNPNQDFTEQADKIFNKFFQNDHAKMIFWPKFLNIWQNFLEKNQEIAANQDFTEISVEKTIENITLKGKIDRISLNQDQKLTIFDYKTGQPPSKKDVLSGLQPQLTIYALLLASHPDFEQEIGNLSYWKLSSSGQNEIKLIAKDQEVAKLIKAAEIGLEKLFKYYQKPQNTYQISPNQPKKHDYSHLQRTF